MSLVKKIFVLLIFFVILNVVSIFNFDYKSYLGDNDNFELKASDSNSFGFTTYLDNLKTKISNIFSDDISKQPSNIVLVKRDGVIEINGLFPNEQDAKNVIDLLDVNREAQLDFEENRVTDFNLLNKLALLVPSFKDFFEDNSQISIINNEVTLKGELKDESYKVLLDSLIARIDIDIKLDVIVPVANISNDFNDSLPTENKDITPNPRKMELAKETPKPNKKDLQESINKALVENKINFERRSTKVTDSSISTIEKIGKIIKENPTINIEVAGHTDSRGNDLLNKQISQDRANSVKNILVNSGVNETRIKAIGYGEEFPIAKDDENGLSEINRRVEFIIGE